LNTNEKQREKATLFQNLKKVIFLKGKDFVIEKKEREERKKIFLFI